MSGGQKTQDVATALAQLATLATTILNATTAAGTTSALIAKATSEGRTTFTDEEWAQIDSDEAEAGAELDASKNPGT